MLVAVPLGLIVGSLVAAGLLGLFTSVSSEVERQHLIQEGSAITDAMEKANRDKDWSHVQEIRERRNKFHRQTAEYLDKREAKP